MIENAGQGLVDVAGLEPAAPCLQSKLRNTMWLFRLAFNYVVVHGAGGCLAGCVPIFFPRFWGEPQQIRSWLGTDYQRIGLKSVEQRMRKSGRTKDGLMRQVSDNPNVVI